MKPDSLFKAQNPLQDRLGKAFFEDLPETPGIYQMFGREEALLYVGKAKNLRNRLFTYRRVNGENSSRKVRRLVRMIHHITYEQLPSEEEALLRENELIRTHRPPFNRAKKAPETYYYITVLPEGHTMTFDLRMHCREEDRHFTYGAFKGHRRVRRALGALLRQLYIIQHQIETPFALPVQLNRNLTPVHYQMRLNTKMQQLLKRYLEGRDDELLYRLVDSHQKHSRLEHFLGKLILKDMEALRWFYDGAARRNFEVCEKLDLEDLLIPQEKLDDYLVKWAFSK